MSRRGGGMGRSGSRGTRAAERHAHAHATADGMFTRCTGRAATCADQLPQWLRDGLRRIDVVEPDGQRFERFVYAFKGPLAEVAAFARAQVAAGHYLAEMHAVDNTVHAVLFTHAPISIGALESDP